jgi:hypothetical protein
MFLIDKDSTIGLYAEAFAVNERRFSCLGSSNSCVFLVIYEGNICSKQIDLTSLKHTPCFYGMSTVHG